MRRIAGMSGRAARALPSSTAVGLIASALLVLSLASDVPARAGLKNPLHYASNGNFSSSGTYLPGVLGFNLADVSSVAQLNSLPDGVKGLVWVGQCKGVDSRFLSTVHPYVGNPKLFGFYLMDDPDPTGLHRSLCKADNLKAESDWIHANVPGAKTFVLLMDMSSSRTPSFAGTYNPANSHVDLFGIDPYPCRTELKDCDYEAIDRYVAAAESWGVPRENMVPVYQAFGGGNWVDDGGGRYALPTTDQLQQMLARWEAIIPAPEFDYVYSWGSQNAHVGLDRSPDLQAVFRLRNKRLSGRLQGETAGREMG
jgi:hypothetical protein